MTEKPSPIEQWAERITDELIKYKKEREALKDSLKICIEALEMVKIALAYRNENPMFLAKTSDRISELLAEFMSNPTISELMSKAEGKD